MGVYILDSKRSAIGKFNGALKGITCQEISSQIITQMLNEVNIKKENVDELIVGNVLQANQGQNIARQIILNCKFPIECCGYTINMVCGSGMKAVFNAYVSIKAKQAKCIIAGGVENMSNSPYMLLTNEIKSVNQKDIISHMIKDSLIDAVSGEHMGKTAENIAQKYNITREEQDLFAYNSHVKAAKAIEDKVFTKEIVPIHIKDREILVDEHVRNDCSIKKLNSLKPTFSADGTVTAGNSSGINDGGSFLIIADEEYRDKAEAEIIDFAQIGNEPEIMGMGAYLAIKKLIDKNNISFSDIDLFEINEAFAVQTIAVINELSQNYKYKREELISKVNITGGAIALGHPLGASGARVITTLITNLKRRNMKYGVASLCIGGGMGIAILIKNVD